MGKYTIYFGDHEHHVTDHVYECNTLKDLRYLLTLAPYDKEQTIVNVYEDGGFYENMDYDWIMSHK